MTIESIADRRPSFRLERHFPGRTRARGLFQDRFGTLRRQFDVAIDSSWDGERLTLVEDFSYDDGAEERRVWTLRPVGETGYEGGADGVVGTARGSVDGSVFRWRYRFRLPIGKRSLTVTFDDWMVLQPDGRVINRAKVTKFGILLGEVTLVFDPVAEAASERRSAA
ncbi:MAG: DUF3833 family protein [Alphaproteobacteria bacterium]|jgi:hypothetical protein|nr:DUF3833 family protein [Alphaproteobacteria bacterium]